MNCRIQFLSGTGYIASARSLAGLVAEHAHCGGKSWRMARAERGSRRRASRGQWEPERPLLGMNWVLTVQGVQCSLQAREVPDGGRDTAIEARVWGWIHLQQGLEPWSLGCTRWPWQDPGTSQPAAATVKAAATQAQGRLRRGFDERDPRKHGVEGSCIRLSGQGNNQLDHNCK